MLKTNTNRVNFNLVETSGNTAVSMEQYIQDRTQLTELTIPETTPYIGTYAFINCLGLTKVVVPNSVDVIEENAFNNNSIVSKIIVRHSLEFIKQKNFKQILIKHCKDKDKF